MIMLPEVKMDMEDKMTIEERYQYLRRMKKRYQKANRQERSRLLDEMEAYTGLHRKSLIRLLKTDIKRRLRTKERGPSYGSDIRAIIALAAQALDYPCAERLQPVLLSTVKNLARWEDLHLTPEQEEKLTKISVATLRRILNSLHRDKPRPAPHSLQDRNPWRKEVPMLRLPYDLDEPGHMEVDLVHHCGLSASGEYVHTLQMVDIATGWVELVAVLGRSYLVIRPAAHSLPHPDNDTTSSASGKRKSPVLSSPAADLITRAITVLLSRGSLLGYDRLDTVVQTLPLNQIYQKVWI
jgi:hypothetical protein